MTPAEEALVKERRGKSLEKVERDGQTINVVRYLSPSALQTFDPMSDGCPRKWGFQYVEGFKQPSTKAMEAGTELHAEIERYLLTGSKDMSALALAGLHMIPVPRSYPDPSLEVEAEMSAPFSDPAMAGVLMVARDAMLEGKYKEADDLLRAHGIVSASGVPVIGRIDLRHERGENVGGTSVEETVDPPGTIEICDHKTTSNIDYAKTPAQLGRSIQMLAYAVDSILKTPGRDAPIRLSHHVWQTKGAAKTRKSTILMSRAMVWERWEYAEGLARQVLDAATLSTANEMPANPRACGSFGGCPHRDRCDESKNGGLAKFFAKPASDETLIRFGKRDATPAKDSKMGFLEKLRSKDAAMKGPAPDPRFLPAWKTILSLGRGQPALGGECCKQFLISEGRHADVSSISGVAGAGDMGGSVIADLDELCAIAQEVAEATAAQAAAIAEPAAAVTATAPLAPTSPDAPEPDPALASAGAEGKDPLKPNKKPKAAPKKTEEPKVETQVAAATASDASELVVYVDVVVRGLDPSVGNLNAWVQRIADQISEKAGCDLRACQDKPLAFGGWKGILAMRVREDEIPFSVGVLHAAGSEIMEVAAEALAARATVFVRGTR